MKLFVLAIILMNLLTLSTEQSTQLSSDELNNQWSRFKSSNGKQYSGSTEENIRKYTFTQNYKNIKHTNSQQSSYKLGVNKFSDLSLNEFKATKLNAIPPPTNALNIEAPPRRLLTTINTIDWSVLNGVSGVKDQGTCGSCWAFSAVASVESKYMMSQPGSVQSFSEQELIDCYSRVAQGNYGYYYSKTGTMGNGCNGGWPLYGLQWIYLFKISLASSYPYAKANQLCQGNIGSTFSIGLPGYSSSTCNSIHTALMSQPVVVALAADSFQLYSSGVLTACAGLINHAVLLVGADLTNNFWRLKNSWGTSWGESGFIRITYGNTCQMCNYYASWAT